MPSNWKSNGDPPASFLEAQTKADDCAIALTKALAQFQQARTAWIEATLAYELEKAANEPLWPEFPNWPPEGCPSCEAKTVHPTVHPKTEQDGVRCFGCGKAWLVPKHYVPKKKAEIAVFNYRQALRVLVGELDYDLDMAKYLVDTGGAARLLRLAQQMPAYTTKHHAQVALIAALSPPGQEAPAVAEVVEKTAPALPPKKKDNHPF